MSDKNIQYTNFRGIVQNIEQKSYVDKKTNENKTYWSVSLQDEASGEQLQGAIFDEKQFNKTPETINELIGQTLNCSYHLDEQNRKRISIFAPFVQKPSFSKAKLIDENEYLIKIKKVSIFQSKESKNMFVKYELDYDSIQPKKFDEASVKTIAKMVGCTLEEAKQKILDDMFANKENFKNYDWGIIEQISSIAPNKNGKMVQPFKTKKGTMFDPIQNAIGTLASIIIKNHNATSEAKWNKQTTADSINQLINGNDLGGLKELVKNISGLEVFLNVKNGNPELYPDVQFARVRAFDGKSKR